MIDICRTTDAVILDTEVDLIIQQIDILFDTTPGEVLGYMDFGTNYSNFIYELNIGASTIANVVYDDIVNNVALFGWHLDVDVKFLLGTENDIIIIGIQLSKGGDYYTHIYRVSEYQEGYQEDEYLT